MSVEILGEILFIDEIQQFCLSGKNLTTFPIEICKLVKLEKLFLDKNQISIIPPEISNLVNLEVLYLNDNNISELPIEITTLSKLRILRLDYNKIENIPPEITNLINLHMLPLYSNKIKTLPREILKIKDKIKMEYCSYDMDNLDSDCEFIILYKLKVPLTNLPINLKEIWLYEPKIEINQHKIPFGCKLYVDDELKN
jgi:Leucine-rich repeat (LRR) protein